MDAEEEGMLEAEDGEVEDDSFEGGTVHDEAMGKLCTGVNHSPQRPKMVLNQESADRKNSNFDYMKESPRRDASARGGGHVNQWTEDDSADSNVGIEKDNTSQSADTDKEERRRKKKEKKREKKLKREKKRKRSESEELDDDGETLIKKSKPVSTCNARIGQQSSSPMWYNADELEEGEELSEGEEKENAEDTQSTSDFIRNQRAIAEKDSKVSSTHHQSNISKSLSQKYSHVSSDEKHRGERDRDRDKDRGKSPRKTRWSPAYDSGSNRDFRDRDQESSKDSPPSDRRDREGSDSDDQRKRSSSKYSKHASSDDDSEVLGGRSSDEVSRDDDKNRRRKRWENDEEGSVHDDDSRKSSKRGRNERENDREGPRGGVKNKYWKKSFGSSWHHEDHDQPVGSPPNSSSKDQDDYAAKLSEYRTSQEKDKMLSKKRKKIEKRGGDFDNGNGYGGDWKPCFFYRNGFCKLGPDCDFSHDCEQKIAKKEDVCRPYMHGNCKWGDNCNMLHGQFPCKYHARGLVCYKGDYCLFSHDKPTPYTLQLLEKWLNSNPRHQNNQNNFNSGPHYSAPPQTNLNNQNFDNHSQNNSRNNSDQSSRSQQGSNSRLPSKWSDHPPTDKGNSRDRDRDRDRCDDYFDEEEEEEDSKPPRKSDRDFGDPSDSNDGGKKYSSSGSQSNARSPSNQFNNNSNNQPGGLPVGLGPGNFNNQRMTSPGMQRFSLPGMPPVTQSPGGQITPMNYNSPRGPVPNQMGNGGPPGSSGMMNAPHSNATAMAQNNNTFVSGAPYNGPGPNMSMPPRGVMGNTPPYYNNNQNFIRGNYMAGNVPTPSMPFNPNQPMHGPHPPGPQMGHPCPPPRMMMGNHPQPNPGMPYNPNMQNPPPTAFMNNIPQPGFPQNVPPMGHPQRLPMMPGVPLGPSANPQMGGILPIPRPPGSPYGAYPPVDNRENTEDDSIDKLVKVKSDPEDEEKPNKVEEAPKKTETQKEGPKLRIETFPSEAQSSRPASNTPTTPTPVLHKGTQLIPIETLDNSIKDPRVSKGFVSSSIYYDISSRPVKITVQTAATTQDGAQISCTELIPWRLPLKVDFAKMFMSSLSIDTMSSSPIPDSPTKTPTRPTDPRKRSTANSSKSQQPSSPKTQSPPIVDRKVSSPYSGTESAKPLSPLASPITNRSLSSESEANPPSPVTPGPELFSRLDSYTSTEVKIEPGVTSVKIEAEPNSPEASPEKASPSGLTPFVLPSESLSPNKADFDSQTEGQKYLGSYANKPKASLSIAEYMKRRKASRNSGEPHMEQEKSDNVLPPIKSSEGLMGVASDDKVAKDVDMSSDPYDFDNESLAAIPSFKDLFKDPTASPFG